MYSMTAGTLLIAVIEIKLYEPTLKLNPPPYSVAYKNILLFAFNCKV